jgi:hypothetical protein
MKKENTITITVSGTPGSGKSRLTLLLKRFLNDYGFDVDFDHGIDFKDEDHFNAVANNDIAEVIQRIKETTKVSLKQIQLQRENVNMKTIAQQLNVKEFPFEIKDKNGKIIYQENSEGWWFKAEFDTNGNLIYSEYSTGFWYKCEFDSNGNEIYYETSDGEIEDKRPKPCVDKVVEIDGIKYKLTAV